MVGLPLDVHLAQDYRWEVHNYVQFKHGITDAQVRCPGLRSWGGRQKADGELSA